jgi:LPS O-antigen subunit length determinant protein (WzzB/FepE family)
MSEQSFNSIQDDEISLTEIIDFLIDSWKTIVAVGVLGLLSAVAYLFVTPSQYEATAQIRMAQIDSGNTTNPLGTNLEDPNTLMARLKLPTAFSEKEVQACKLEKLKFPTEALANSVVKLTAVKGVASLVELKIRGESKEAALTCAQAIFEIIKDSQHDIMKPYIEEAKTLLLKYQVRLNDSQSVIARADKSGQAMSAAYLANRDELKFLSDETIRLNAIIAAGDTRHTKLVSPIYASDKPVFPKKTMSLVLGLLAGLFMGLLYVLARKAWRNYNLNTSR